MGACCYPPSPKRFLWWYWFVLTILVALPLACAGWIVHRDGKDRPDPRTLYLALGVFWFGVVLTTVLAAVTVFWAAGMAFLCSALVFIAAVFCWLLLAFRLSWKRHWILRIPILLLLLITGFIVAIVFLELFAAVAAVFPGSQEDLSLISWSYPHFYLPGVLFLLPAAWAYVRYLNIANNDESTPRQRQWAARSLVGLGFISVLLAIYFTAMQHPYRRWAEDLNRQGYWSIAGLLEDPEFFFHDMPGPGSWESD